MSIGHADVRHELAQQLLRTLRATTPVRTAPDEDVRIGGSRVVRASDNDEVLIVACRITVDEAGIAAGAIIEALTRVVAAPAPA